eukprot:UN11341
MTVVMEILTEKIEVLVSGFFGHNCHTHVPFGVIQCVISYSNGDEGTTPINIQKHDDITSIAQDAKIKQDIKPELLNLIDVRQYFKNVNPNKMKFCMEMKRRYKAKIGESCKTFQYLLNLRLNPEGEETGNIIPGYYVIVWKPNSEGMH